jgi:hypothetical protein
MSYLAVSFVGKGKKMNFFDPVRAYDGADV